MGLGFRFRRHVPFVMGSLGAGLGLFIAACVGEDKSPPFQGQTGNDSGSNVGDSTTTPNDTGSSSGGEDARTFPPGAGPNPGPPSRVDPSCPPVAEYLGCVAGNVPYGQPAQPALHLDACAGGSEEIFLTSWTASRGPNANGTPGALYCRGGFGGRPTVIFEKHGFQIGSSTALDPLATDITVIAVMSYNPGVNGETEAGGIVFQRNQPNYPFRGPQITANFARQLDPIDDYSLDSTDLLGVSLRFGLAVSADPQHKGVAAVSTTPLPNPSVVVLHKLADTLTLRVNGAVIATDVVPSDATYGQGMPINIGSGGSSSPNNYFKGKLSELLLYTSNPTDLAGLETALKTKWGIP